MPAAQNLSWRWRPLALSDALLTHALLPISGYATVYVPCRSSPESTGFRVQSVRPPLLPPDQPDESHGVSPWPYALSLLWARLRHQILAQTSRRQHPYQGRYLPEARCAVPLCTVQWSEWWHGWSSGGWQRGERKAFWPRAGRRWDDRRHRGLCGAAVHGPARPLKRLGAMEWVTYLYGTGRSCTVFWVDQSAGLWSSFRQRAGRSSPAAVCCAFSAVSRETNGAAVTRETVSYGISLSVVLPLGVFATTYARFTPPQNRIGWAKKGQQRSKFYSKRPYFCCWHAVQSAGYSQYPTVFTRISNVVDLCWPIYGQSYPVMWRCEPGFTQGKF